MRWKPLWLGATVLVASCSSGPAYTPRPSPRIVAHDDSLWRSGRKYDLGVLGGGAAELVRGNAEAEAHARRYRRKTLAAWGLYFGGLGGILASPAAGNKVGFWTIFSTSAVGTVAGIVMLESARFNLRDAVNVYNDALLEARRPSSGDER